MFRRAHNTQAKGTFQTGQSALSPYATSLGPLIENRLPLRSWQLGNLLQLRAPGRVVADPLSININT
jgi:hypothetical protein